MRIVLPATLCRLQHRFATLTRLKRAGNTGFVSLGRRSAKARDDRTSKGGSAARCPQPTRRTRRFPVPHLHMEALFVQQLHKKGFQAKCAFRCPPSLSSGGFVHVADIGGPRGAACFTLLRLCKSRACGVQRSSIRLAQGQTEFSTGNWTT